MPVNNLPAYGTFTPIKSAISVLETRPRDRAHVSSGITVAAFTKRTAIARATEPALKRMSASIIALSDHEGFTAHGNAIRRRFD